MTDNDDNIVLVIPEILRDYALASLTTDCREMFEDPVRWFKHLSKEETQNVIVNFSMIAHLCGSSLPTVMREAAGGHTAHPAKLTLLNNTLMAKLGVSREELMRRLDQLPNEGSMH